jgi:hypothetical protein
VAESGVARTLALLGLLGLAVGAAALPVPLAWLRLLLATYGFCAGGTLLLAALGVALWPRLRR